MTVVVLLVLVLVPAVAVVVVVVVVVVVAAMVVVAVLVVEVSEQASERATRRAGRLDDARVPRGKEGGGKGSGREGREETKGKRVQAGLGSDEGECVTVCIVGSLQHRGRLPSTCPALPCLCLPCKPASRPDSV